MERAEKLIVDYFARTSKLFYYICIRVDLTFSYLSYVTCLFDYGESSSALVGELYHFQPHAMC